MRTNRPRRRRRGKYKNSKVSIDHKQISNREKTAARFPSPRTATTPPKEARKTMRRPLFPTVWRPNLAPGRTKMRGAEGSRGICTPMAFWSWRISPSLTITKALATLGVRTEVSFEKRYVRPEAINRRSMHTLGNVYVYALCAHHSHRVTTTV